MASDPSPQLGRDVIYRLIQWVMLGDILIGIALIGVGAFVVDETAFVIVGVGLAIIGFALFLLFRQLARRAAQGTAATRRASPHDLRR